MNYYCYTRVLDDGEAITRVIIEAAGAVAARSVSAADFTVSFVRRYQGKMIDEGQRMITDVFVSDGLQGKPLPQGKYIHLVLFTAKGTPGAGRLTYDEETQKTVPLEISCAVQIHQPLPYLDANISDDSELKMAGYVRPQVDAFNQYESSLGILYREFAPVLDGSKKALIIWLHGMGEGGRDNELPITANRGGVAFASRRVQRLFHGAYVVVPQCPTFWMPGMYEGKMYTDDYTSALLAMIDEICLFHPDIDEDRIYIGGCSMGGYQTLKTVIAAPRRFAAAFPICAAYEMSLKEAFRVRDVPMFFVHCLADTTVPASNSVRNHDRLIQAGGEAEITLYPDIRCRGYLYPPHSAWIPALNNDPVSSHKERLMNWLAARQRNATKNEAHYVALPALAVLAAVLYQFYRQAKKRR